MLRIENYAHLLVEIGYISRAVNEKNITKLQELKNDYINRLRVPKSEFFRIKHISVFSKEISYHLLSVYLLLDIIDLHFDGKQIIKTFNTDNLVFMDELQVRQLGEISEIDDIYEPVKQISNIIPYPVFLFLVPYQNKRVDFLIQKAYPGIILVLFANGKEKTEANFFEGFGQFYLKYVLKGMLPFWAKDESEFLAEFRAWCEKKPSLFQAKQSR